MPEKWFCVVDLKQRTWVYVGKDPRVAMILGNEGTRLVQAEELVDVTAKAREILADADTGEQRESNSRCRFRSLGLERTRSRLSALG